MTSKYQLYQKTIEGFLASLDRLGEQQAERSSASRRVGALKNSQAAQPAPPLTEQETQMLEEAVADIEQLMQKQQQNRFDAISFDPD